MTILPDTNILLRLAIPTDPAHAAAVAAVRALRANGATLHTVPQNLFEFWVVATRPVANNGMGMSTAECVAEIARVKFAFPVVFDLPGLLAEWERLVATHHCQGKIAHDARIVAAMLVHGFTHLLTFNDQDFRRFSGITLLNPVTVVAPPSVP